MKTSRSTDWVALKSKTPLVTLGFVDARGEVCCQEITSLPAVIGRSDIAEVEVHDPYVSRIQCAIAFTGDELVLRDLESAHGTCVNDKAVRVCRLREGDVIHIVTRTSMTILRIADVADFFQATWL